MIHEELMKSTLDTLALTLGAAFSKGQMTSVLVGYLASCEIYLQNPEEGVLPEGILEYHNEAKRILGLESLSRNGGY